VLPGNRVTFRLRAPNAGEVFLEREGAKRVRMQKDEQGVWSVTTEPLTPDLQRGQSGDAESHEIPASS
jgi:1,4-alpha-glucan branching enzyme